MKNLSLLLIFLFVSVTAISQTDRAEDMKEMNQEKKAMQYADKMAAKLTLTAEQKEDVMKARMKMLDNKMELMADHKGMDMEDDMEDMADDKANMSKDKMKLHADFKEDMQEILTEAQFAKWSKMEMKNMDKMHVDKKKMKKEDHDDDTEW